MTSRRFLQCIAGASLLALIFLCLLWETTLAPLRPRGSLLALKALPLLFPLLGILRGRIYTYQWSLMLILFYFTEGIVRAWSDQGGSQWLAMGEVTLSLLFFFSAIFYIRLKSNSAPPRADELK